MNVDGLAECYSLFTKHEGGHLEEQGVGNDDHGRRERKVKFVFV